MRWFTLFKMFTGLVRLWKQKGVGHNHLALNENKNTTKLYKYIIYLMHCLQHSMYNSRICNRNINKNAIVLINKIVFILVNKNSKINFVYSWVTKSLTFVMKCWISKKKTIFVCLDLYIIYLTFSTFSTLWLRWQCYKTCKGLNNIMKKNNVSKIFLNTNAFKCTTALCINKIL